MIILSTELNKNSELNVEALLQNKISPTSTNKYFHVNASKHKWILKNNYQFVKVILWFSRAEWKLRTSLKLENVLIVFAFKPTEGNLYFVE